MRKYAPRAPLLLSLDTNVGQVEYAIQSLGQSESPYGVRVRLEPTDLVSEPALTAAIFGSVQAYKNLPAVVPRCFLGSSGSATAPRVLVIGTQPNSAAEKRLLGGLVALAVTVGCIVGKVEGWKTAVDVLEILFVAVAFVHF